MKKAKEGKKSRKVKEIPKTKDNKEFSKPKISVISNYYPEELPKR